MSDDHRAIEAWLRERSIVEVECIVPDLAGVARGKILPTDKFIEGLAGGQHRLPKNVLVHTLTGDFPPPGAVSIDVSDSDFVLEPDPATLTLVPWYNEPTAQVIADCVLRDGGHSPFYSRRVLASLLERYVERGWHPVIAPEIEFYLVEKNTDPDQPLKPPIGASGRREAGRQEFGIDAVNEFDPFFEDLYDYCEAQELDIDTLNHESGAGQVEINFRHGEALRLADQVFVFKRTVRQTALRHGFYATFMAKPMQGEPGSAMHVHQSVYEGAERGRSFPTKTGLSRRRSATTSAACSAFCRRSRRSWRPTSTRSAGFASARASRSTSAGVTTTASRACVCRTRRPGTAGSRTACRAPTRTPTSPSPPRSLPAISA